jgi:hypothetical protein
MAAEQRDYADALIALAVAGVRMRRAQKAYFKERTKEALIASKNAEAEFDRQAQDIPFIHGAAPAPSPARSAP